MATLAKVDVQRDPLMGVSPPSATNVEQDGEADEEELSATDFAAEHCRCAAKWPLFMMPLSLGLFNTGMAWVFAMDEGSLLPSFAGSWVQESTRHAAAFKCATLLLVSVIRMITVFAADWRSATQELVHATPAYCAGDMALMGLCIWISRHTSLHVLAKPLWYYAVIAHSFYQSAFIGGCLSDIRISMREGRVGASSATDLVPGSDEEELPSPTPGPVWQRALHRLWETADGTWFVPFAGIATAAGTGPRIFGPQEPFYVCFGATWIALLTYLVMVPFIAARILGTCDLHSKPQSAVLMAPPGLIFNGFAVFFGREHLGLLERVMMVTLFAMAVLSALLVIPALPRLLDTRDKGFTPSIAVCLFPMATIGQAILNCLKMRVLIPAWFVVPLAWIQLLCTTFVALRVVIHFAYHSLYLCPAMVLGAEAKQRYSLMHMPAKT